MLSCNIYDYSNCSGGWFYAAYEIYMDLGIVAESCMPFSGTCETPACNADACAVKGQLASFARVPDDVDVIKAALMQGPLAVCCRMSDLFYYYKSGVYRAPRDASSIDHAVLLVGWDNTLDSGAGAWIIKNSWGTDWGLDGYGYISYDDIAYAYQVDYQPDSAAALTVYVPHDDDIWVAGTQHVLGWATDLAAHRFQLSYRQQFGNTNVMIADQVPGTSREFVWTVPDTPRDDCVIEVKAYDQRGKLLAADTSNGSFAITPPRSAWPAAGVIVTALPGNVAPPCQVGHDGQDGAAILTFRPSQSMTANVYLSRIDHDGQLVWPQAVQVTATAVASTARMVSDPSGATIIVWQDLRQVDRPRIYAQRIDTAGNPTWATGGIVVSPIGPGYEFTDGWAQHASLASDGQAGAVVVWDYYTADYASSDIYAQRVASDGTLLWGTAASHGVPVCAAPGYQVSPVVSGAGAGFVVVGWADRRNGTDAGVDVFAQKLDNSGLNLWAANGVRANATNAGTGSFSQLELRPGAGGDAFLFWRSHFPALQYQYYLQKVNSAGAGWPVDLAIGGDRRRHHRGDRARWLRWLPCHLGRNPRRPRALGRVRAARQRGRSQTVGRTRSPGVHGARVPFVASDHQ